jgi:hypothetical protein
MNLSQFGAAGSVIASEAKQSSATRKELDCFVASAPRNDGANGVNQLQIIPL